MATLDEALARSVPGVIRRFSDEWPVTPRQSAALFREMTKLLWVAEIWSREHETAFGIDPAVTVLDEMWHTFILFTASYERWCKDLFGHYLHHEPALDPPRINGSARALAAHRRELRARLVFIERHLGEETLVLWYRTYPAKYPHGVFRRRS